MRLAPTKQMEANPEIKEAAMREMVLVSEEMSALLKQHKIHFPTMILSMFGQFPVFISLFLATRDVSVPSMAPAAAFRTMPSGIVPPHVSLAVCHHLPTCVPLLVLRTPE